MRTGRCLHSQRSSALCWQAGTGWWGGGGGERDQEGGLYGGRGGKSGRRQAGCQGMGREGREEGGGEGEGKDKEKGGFALHSRTHANWMVGGCHSEEECCLAEVGGWACLQAVIGTNEVVTCAITFYVIIVQLSGGGVCMSVCLSVCLSVSACLAMSDSALCLHSAPSERPDGGAAGRGFIPNWVQCTESNLNSTVVNGTIMSCNFSKMADDTVLR